MSAVAARKATRQKQRAGHKGNRRPSTLTTAIDIQPNAPREKLLTVRIPFRVTTRGGRKLVVGPSGQEAGPSSEHVDSAIVKALARAFRWRKLVETGVYDGVGHIARAEKINPSYVSRVIRLTLLAPVIIENALEGRHINLQLANLLVQIPPNWDHQKRRYKTSFGELP